MKIAILCGGPTLERGISLNSARSVMEHLQDGSLEIVPIYFDHKRRAYKISRAQLYSNTPSDFDFKLSQTAIPLSEAQLIKTLKQVDIAFPAMHGSFGEDGGIQKFLEINQIPFVGAGSIACRQAFDKHKANQLNAERGFFTLPSALLQIYHTDHKQILEKFFQNNNITRAIVKPSSGGSSIGVFSVSSVEQSMEKAELIFSKRMDTRVVVEPFAEGSEFTVIILQNRFGLPVAILPTEIQIDYTENQIFDFRKKYLPTNHVAYHCPPRFSNALIEKIQTQAEQLFQALNMKDFARFDGWILKNNNIWFSDFNPISGMEQNSFLFQQASRVGFSHRDVLRYIVKNACKRQNVEFPEFSNNKISTTAKPVQVLFGGRTSERQVSLMSGTNVWLKLRNSKKYVPKPFLLDLTGNVWELPYALCLNHTVEEILENCTNAKSGENRLRLLEERVRAKLALKPGEATEILFIPKKISLLDFVKKSKFVFIALHGGMGENGELQAILEKHKVKFNGSGPVASAITIDKWKTSEVMRKAGISGVQTIPSVSIKTRPLLNFTEADVNSLWKRLQKNVFSKKIIVKPQADGCSSGIVRLNSARDLKKYLDLIKARAKCIPKNTFASQSETVDMPKNSLSHLLFEKFIETDSLRVKGNQLKYKRKTGWLEVTVGILQEGKKFHAFLPSITIAEGEVLSVEEKFQGGTGINITPPPETLVSKKAINKTQYLIAQISEKLGIKGYARIDAFMNVDTGNIIVIEANSLPGLTPSTVFYHQALAEKPPLYPAHLLEKIIASSGY